MLNAVYIQLNISVMCFLSFTETDILFKITKVYKNQKEETKFMMFVKVEI